MASATSVKASKQPDKVYTYACQNCKPWNFLHGTLLMLLEREMEIAFFVVGVTCFRYSELQDEQIILLRLCTCCLLISIVFLLGFHTNLCGTGV